MKRIITLFALLTLFAIGAKAQIVGANEGKKTSTSSTTPLYKPTGHYLRLEAGFPNFFTVAYGYQINSWVMVGLGGGYGEVTNVNETNAAPGYRKYYFLEPGFPVYSEFIFSTPRYKSSVSINLKVGANIPTYYYYDSQGGGNTYLYWKLYEKRFYSAINLGYNYKNFGFFGGVSTNSADLVFSAGFSYNIPLKVH